MMVSSSLKLVKYLLSAHTNAWYVLNGASYSEPFLELQDEPELGGHGSELYPVTSSMNLCSLKTACPYTAMCSSTECRQFCSTDKKKRRRQITIVKKVTFHYRKKIYFQISNLHWSDE